MLVSYSQSLFWIFIIWNVAFIDLFFNVTWRHPTAYKCLLVLVQPGSGYLPQSWPQTEPKQRPGNSAHSPSLTPEALPSSLPLSFPGHGKKAQIRAARVGARQGRKERWMERKEKMAKDLGDIFKAHMLRLSSTFSGEGWWMWRGCVCWEWS